MRSLPTLPIQVCALALVALSPTQAGAQCPLDDALEDNDSCQLAWPVAAGLTSGLLLHGAAHVNGADEDYWLIQGVPSGQILTVDVLFDDAAGDIDLRLFADPGVCVTQVAYSGSVTDDESVSVVNGSGAAADYALRVQAYGLTFDCNDYELLVSVTADPCASQVDDGLEPNDDCGSSIVLATGVHAGLFVSETDPDHYSIDVPPGETLTVDVGYAPALGADVDMSLFDDGGCSSPVDADYGSGGAGQVQWVNRATSPATVQLAVRVAAGAGCGNYTLDVATAPAACSDPLSDDPLEDNDDCTSARWIHDGTQTGLFVSKEDDDFFAVSVASGEQLDVDVYFSTAVADIDVYLYDDPVGCGDLGSFLVNGFTGTDDEHLTWVNAGPSSQLYYIQVVVWEESGGDCGSYDLQIAGSEALLVSPYCYGDGTAESAGSPVACPCGNASVAGLVEGCASSLGHGARLHASGTSAVASDDLVLHLEGAIPDQPSLVVQGTVRIAIPFKDGILCLGNPTERIEVVQLDALGNGSTLGSISSAGAVLPGELRCYQQWYRDPGGVGQCGTGSNFSNALEIRWI